MREVSLELGCDFLFHGYDYCALCYMHFEAGQGIADVGTASLASDAGRSRLQIRSFHSASELLNVRLKTATVTLFAAQHLSFTSSCSIIACSRLSGILIVSRELATALITGA